MQSGLVILQVIKHDIACVMAIIRLEYILYFRLPRKTSYISHLFWFKWGWSCFSWDCTIVLTLWGRVTHICVSKIIIIGSDTGLPPGQRQAIIRTNAYILLIGPLGTNFSEILVEILTKSFMKIRLKVSSAKWWPFCLGLNVLTCPQPLVRLLFPLQL